jgi:hypothetical protein
MARPAVPAVSETWYDELATTQPGDEARGWPFLIFLGGLGHTFGPLHDLVRDTDEGPGWSILLDPARCPAWALIDFFASFALPRTVRVYVEPSDGSSWTYAIDYSWLR